MKVSRKHFTTDIRGSVLPEALVFVPGSISACITRDHGSLLAAAWVRYDLLGWW